MYETKISKYRTHEFSNWWWINLMKFFFLVWSAASIWSKSLALLKLSLFQLSGSFELINSTCACVCVFVCWSNRAQSRLDIVFGQEAKYSLISFWTTVTRHPNTNWCRCQSRILLLVLGDVSVSLCCLLHHSPLLETVSLWSVEWVSIIESSGRLWVGQPRFDSQWG